MSGSNSLVILYGIALGQLIYYARHFPGDPRLTKFMVLLIFSWTCETRQPWGMFVALPINYATTFAVQSFYCRQVWIITGNKRHITIAIFVTVILQFGLGGWCALETFVHFFLIITTFEKPFLRNIRVGTIDFFFTDPFILYVAAMSTLCDFLITGAVFKYMYNSDLRRRVNFIQDLAIVFINMGALTWYNRYVNSNLAVLNARRSIRQREERRPLSKVTLSTVSVLFHGRPSHLDSVQEGPPSLCREQPKLTIVTIFLSRLLGVSAWAGIGVLVFALFILITVIPASMHKAAPWFMMSPTHHPRGFGCNPGIRIVKINNWEDNFLEKLEGDRTDPANSTRVHFVQVTNRVMPLATFSLFGHEHMGTIIPLNAKCSQSSYCQGF
ncbi:hypothetical protein BU15DRAFT_68611 [Melanogaster broomeanus]|nr:hypothetical protein BU15DRAFT_68611 [Melanogaster broomeanus]